VTVPWLAERLERLEKLHARELAGMAAADERDSLAPSPDYSTMDTMPPPAPDTCGCEEAVALRLRLVQAERRAKLWHELARVKHRLLHVNDYERCDSQVTRPVP
jgi:hypothetical protein